jgi:hypothetical protein
MKEVIAAVAVVLSFIGYAPYIRDIIKGKTHPHTYSWFVWTFITVIIFALQIDDGAGAGAFVTLGAGSMGFIVFTLGLRYGKQDVTRSDTLFFISALAATGIWLIANQPVLSVALLVAIDMLGFAPTVRKSWNKPHSETLIMYQIGAFRHGLSLLALSSYTFVTVLFPATWALANIAFSTLLILRRQKYQ